MKRKIVSKIDIDHVEDYSSYKRVIWGGLTGASNEFDESRITTKDSREKRFGSDLISPCLVVFVNPNLSRKYVEYNLE